MDSIRHCCFILCGCCACCPWELVPCRRWQPAKDSHRCGPRMLRGVGQRLVVHGARQLRPLRCLLRGLPRVWQPQRCCCGRAMRRRGRLVVWRLGVQLPMCRAACAWERDEHVCRSVGGVLRAVLWHARIAAEVLVRRMSADVPDQLRWNAHGI